MGGWSGFAGVTKRGQRKEGERAINHDRIISI